MLIPSCIMRGEGGLSKDVAAEAAAPERKIMASRADVFRLFRRACVTSALIAMTRCMSAAVALRSAHRVLLVCPTCLRLTTSADLRS